MRRGEGGGRGGAGAAWKLGWGGGRRKKGRESEGGGKRGRKVSLQPVPEEGGRWR